MAYLGNTPADRFASYKYQDFTGGSGTSFTLDHPSTTNGLRVVINNVVQEPTEAYSVAGTALTLTGSVTTTDDFYVVFLEQAILTATHPSTQALSATNGTFTGNLVVTGSSVTLPADSKAEFDMWRNTANVTSIATSGTVISGNWERVDEPSSPSSAALGTGMSVDASGIWTFPSTGIWLITYHTRFYADGTAQIWAGGVISVTQDNSSYNQATEPYTNIYATNGFGTTVCEHLMNVTDTANDKIKLSAKSASNATVSGLSTENQTYARFWRIADAQ